MKSDGFAAFIVLNEKKNRWEDTKDGNGIVNPSIYVWRYVPVCEQIFCSPKK